MKQLSSSFFRKDAVTVAPELLGKIIEIKGKRVRIVETEAYGQDPASHAFKRTKRSALMFDTFGRVYVYLIYGMYYCLNFTTNHLGEAGAVLIRAAEPLEGIKDLKSRGKAEEVKRLCSGPGKLCRALGIDKSFNGMKLGREIKVYDDDYTGFEIGRSSRIGIKDALDLEWRFFIKGNLFVSGNS